MTIIGLLTRVLFLPPFIKGLALQVKLKNVKDNSLENIIQD
jgi:hypothetical protein